jgi:hypothetical protein
MRCMEGGVASTVVDVRVDTGRGASAARCVSRLTVVAAFVAVIALIFHVTGSTGPEALANQSVLVLAVLIGQVPMPRRELRSLLQARSQMDPAKTFDPSGHN